jgi:patatin-like phospholipase/acyl hydrolase
MPDKDLRLLSLDGGEVRGLSSLAILKRLMEIINSNASPKSCEYFDMIGGTSTGELIVIMLGRLEMNIDECIDAYVALFDRVFQKKRHRVTINGHVQGRFDIEELERSIREIVKRKNKAGENALLKESANQQCKVLVT